MEYKKFNISRSEMTLCTSAQFSFKKIIIYILTISLIFSMCFMSAENNRVEASANSQNESDSRTFIDSQCTFSVEVSKDGYLEYNISLTGSGIMQKSKYKLQLKSSSTNKVLLDSFLDKAPKTIFLKKGNYVFTVTRVETDNATGIDYSWLFYNEPFDYVNKLKEGSISGSYGEGEYNGDIANATPITKFNDKSVRYVGNFNGVSKDTDVYKIKLDYRCAIDVITSFSRKGSNSKLFTMKITNGNKTITNISSTASTGVYQTGILEAGTYYLVYEAESDSDCWGNDYSFYVTNKHTIVNTVHFYTNALSTYYKGTPINFIKYIKYGLSMDDMKEGKDYKVTYTKGNTNVGKGVMKVTGINGFYGTITRNYTIAPNQITIYKKKTTVSSKPAKRTLKVKWKKIKGATHYQIKYKKKGTKKWKSKTVSANKTSYTIKKLTKGKKYQYKIRGMQKLKGYNTYYSKFSKTKTSKKIK